MLQKEMPHNQTKVVSSCLDKYYIILKKEKLSQSPLMIGVRERMTTFVLCHYGDDTNIMRLMPILIP